MSALAEVREDEATDHIAAIYDDIKASTGLPGVNLIWRHLATRPGVLEAAWSLLGPCYRSGLIATEVHRLRDLLHLDGGVDIRELATREQREAITAIIGYYNGGNPQNLIAFTALGMIGERDRDIARASIEAGPTEMERASAASASSAIGPIPPLPNRTSLDATVMATLERMRARHVGAAPGVTPSLYMHLALFPDLLAKADDALCDFVGGDAFVTAKAELLDRANASAERVAANASTRLCDLTDAQWDGLEDMTPTVAQFIGATIPDLILVGHYLTGGSRG